MKKVEATLIQAYNYVRAFVVSSIKHAELRVKELEKMLENSSGKQTRIKIATLLAKAEYWLNYSDELLAWLIEVGEKVGIARWFLRNSGDSEAKEFTLKLTQEIRRKLKEVRQKCALCLSGVIFEIERDAIALIEKPKLFEEEEERRMLLEEMQRFSEEIEREVKEKVKKILEVRENEVVKKI